MNLKKVIHILLLDLKCDTDKNKCDAYYHLSNVDEVRLVKHLKATNNSR